jgi:hypothetical protein
MQPAWEFDIHNHNHSHSRNHKQGTVRPMYTSMDLMKEPVFLMDKVFTLIVKSLHLIINMLNHVGHELAIRLIFMYILILTHNVIF